MPSQRKVKRKRLLVKEKVIGLAFAQTLGMRVDVACRKRPVPSVMASTRNSVSMHSWVRFSTRIEKWHTVKEDNHSEKKRQQPKKMSVKRPVNFDGLPLPPPLSFALIVPTSASEKGPSRYILFLLGNRVLN